VPLTKAQRKGAPGGVLPDAAGAGCVAAGGTEEAEPLYRWGAAPAAPSVRPSVVGGVLMEIS